MFLNGFVSFCLYFLPNERARICCNPKKATFIRQLIEAASELELSVALIAFLIGYQIIGSLCHGAQLFTAPCVSNIALAWTKIPKVFTQVFSLTLLERNRVLLVYVVVLAHVHAALRVRRRHVAVCLGATEYVAEDVWLEMFEKFPGLRPVRFSTRVGRYKVPKGYTCSVSIRSPD